MRDEVCDWVYEHPTAAFLAGTGGLALAGFALDPKRRGGRALAAWGLMAAVGAVLWPCVSPESEVYGPILWRGSGRERTVALTFDDGPWPPYTDSVLDILAEVGVKATFFVVGRQVGRHPELVERMHREGHQVGNHTRTHANLMLRTPGESQREIREGARAIAEVLGEEPEWFRPPYGMRYPWTLLQARQCGQQTALWSVCPLDFLEPGADVIARRTLEQAHPGAIVLLHDGNGDRSQTVRALPNIIAGLRDQKYRFVRIDQMAPA